MMKKLVSLVLWFCAATFLAQLCVLGIAYSKGNFDRKTVVKVIALLNGIDIQGQRLKEAMVSAKTLPTPTYDDVLNAKVQASLELDSRIEAYVRDRQDLDERKRQLQLETERFDKRRTEFQADLAQKLNGSESTNLKETQKILEVLSAEAAKFQLLKMLENGRKADVVAIIKGMPADKQKKILAEFSQPSDQEKLSEILAELRNGEPLKSLIENAQRDAAQP